MQPDLSNRFDPAAVEDYRQQAHVFLEKARQYLLEDDLHQASEKGWGAAAWMAKAVAVNQGLGVYGSCAVRRGMQDGVRQDRK